MKVTKSQLKQIILEEIQQDKEMLEAIGKLTDSIDNLDVSMDFLASIFTGESGVSIGAAQKQLGRAYRPKTRPMPEPVKEALGMDQEAQLSTKVVPLLMQIAGGNKSVAVEMVSELASLIDELPDEEELDERKLSKGEEKEKEKIVKGMKKSKKDFKKRYGDDAESVMYATATKIAKDKK